MTSRLTALAALRLCGEEECSKMKNGDPVGIRYVFIAVAGRPAIHGRAIDVPVLGFDDESDYAS